MDDLIDVPRTVAVLNEILTAELSGVEAASVVGARARVPGQAPARARVAARARRAPPPQATRKAAVGAG